MHRWELIEALSKVVILADDLLFDDSQNVVSHFLKHQIFIIKNIKHSAFISSLAFYLLM